MLEEHRLVDRLARFEGGCDPRSVSFEAEQLLDALAHSSRKSGIDEPPPTRWITSASNPATCSIVATVP